MPESNAARRGTNDLAAGNTLPGGAASLLAIVDRNPRAVVEYGNRGFVRLKGRNVEGCSFYACVFDAVRHLLPETVQVFRPVDYGSAEYMAALESAQ